MTSGSSHPHTTSRWGTVLLLAGTISLAFIALPTLRMNIPWSWFHAAIPVWVLFSVGAIVGGLKLLWMADYGGTDWMPGQAGQRFQTAIIYSRPNCPLCDEAVELLHMYSRYLPPLTIVDISNDPELTQRHGLSIPVVEFDGEIQFRGQVSEVLLRRLIRMTEPE